MSTSLHVAVRTGVLAFLAVTTAACSAYRIAEPRAEVLKAPWPP